MLFVRIKSVEHPPNRLYALDLSIRTFSTNLTYQAYTDNSY